MSVSCSDATSADIAWVCQAVASLPLMRDYGQTAEQLTTLIGRASHRGEPVRIARTANERPSGLTWFLPRGGLGSAAYLRLLAVCPGQQGRGVGQALLQDFERACADSPGGYFALVSSQNDGAKRFYARQGYRQVGELDGFVRPGATEQLIWKPRQHS